VTTDGEMRRLARLVADELGREAGRHAEVAVRVVVGTQFPGRVALRPEEAAQAIGCSRDHFDEHIGPQLPWLRTGRLKFVPVRALTAWVEQNSARVLGDA
jgi:hypothetical protein